MNRPFFGNDVIVDDSRFLRLGFDGYIAPGTPVSDRAHFDVAKALDVLRADPDLGARFLGLCPGEGSIYWTGEMASERLGGASVGVRVSERRSGIEISGDNRFGEFLGRVRDAYREELRSGVQQERPLRAGQVVCDFTRKGAFASDIELGEQRALERVRYDSLYGDGARSGERRPDEMAVVSGAQRYIHVDEYRPVRFRFDQAMDGTTGHASRGSDEGVSFQRFTCPFGTSYPAPIIVESAAEASFLYEKAIRGELDWTGLFDNLHARGLMKKGITARQKAALVSEYTSQFAWMRERICTDPSLRELPIVASSMLVPDTSLGRSVFDAELAPSPAHVLARYINNPVLLFSPAENAVFRSLGVQSHDEPVTFSVEGRKDGTVNILVVGSDTIGGREPGRRATKEYTRVREKDGRGNDVIVREERFRIPRKEKDDIERDYKAFSERMDSVLAGIPEGVGVRLVTGGTSPWGDGVGIGTPQMVERYVREKGGSVLKWNFSAKKGKELSPADSKAVGENKLLDVVLMEHFGDVYPVLAGADKSVRFELDREDPDSAVTFSGSGLKASGAVCFSVAEDSNNRTLLSMGSLAVRSGLPVVHVQQNWTEAEQAQMLEAGAGLSRSTLSGEILDGGKLLSSSDRRDWELGESNVLAYMDSVTGLSDPFVVNMYPGSAVVAGHSFHSALGVFVALAAEECGRLDRSALLRISRGEGSLSALMSLYGELALFEQSPIDEGMIERCLRRSVRLMAGADSDFARRLMDVDARPIVMPVKEDALETGLFTDLSGHGRNYYGLVLTDERARMVAERERLRAAAEEEMKRATEEAARQQKLSVGARAEGQKVAGGLPRRLSPKVDAVWFLGTNSPLQLVLPDEEHSFEMWDDMEGDDPLVREKAARPYATDGEGGRVPNNFVFLFPSDLAAVTRTRNITSKADSRDLTGVTRLDAAGKEFVCAYGVPVRVDNHGNELANADNLPCSYRLDNDAANYAESLVLADCNARRTAIRHGMALSLPGRVRRDGSEHYTLGQVFMDRIYDRRQKEFVKNPHRAPLNLALTEQYVKLLKRGASYPLNFIPLPQEGYSPEDDAQERKLAREEGRPFISAEGRFVSDLLLSLRIANSTALALGVPLRIPLDEKGRIDLGPGVPERFRELAERRIDEFIGVVRKEDIREGELPRLDRISMFDCVQHVDSMSIVSKDLYLHPNDLVYAFGGYDWSNLLASRPAPVHEMAFRMEDGTVFGVYDTKLSKGMDPDDVNRYMSYEKNDVRRFIVKSTDPSKTADFLAALRGYCERAKAVKVEARLLSEGEARGESLAGFVKLFSSNSDEFATQEYEIGRTMNAYNLSNRFDGFDAEDVYLGKVDANDGFAGYAQVRYELPDGKKSDWHTVTDLELAKDMVMSLVRRVYKDERVVPSAQVLNMLMTSQAVSFAGEAFRRMAFKGHEEVVDDKVVVLQQEESSAPAAAPAAAEPAPHEAPLPAVEPEALEPIVFTESAGRYAKRTWENANSPDVDFTLDFATDFGTPGEQCTARAAGDSFIKIPLPLLKSGGLDCSPAAVKAAVDAVADMLPDEFLRGEPFGVNVAGNGLFTLNASGVSQKQCDEFVTRVFASLVRRGVVVSSVRSGGQTGIDEAGAVAARVLGIPVTVHAPAGWMMRGANGMDVSGEEAFKERFSGKDYRKLASLVTGGARKKMELKNTL